MKYIKSVILIFFTTVSFLSFAQNANSRVEVSFDNDWSFKQEDVAGAEKPEFLNAGWRKLNVPHDWSIEGEYDKLNSTVRGGGYLPSGIGWYRKTFTLADDQKDKKISIEFDGVLANSEVFINGKSLGKRPNGYIGFSYDLTPHLNFGKGKRNVIAVKADNSVQPASRYYAGAGIYRHVRLVTTNPVHFNHWGVFVRTITSDAKQAELSVEMNLTNESKSPSSVELQVSIISPSGKTIKIITSANQNLTASGKLNYAQIIKIDQPELWYTEHPNLYKAVTKIISGGKEIDQKTTEFGIREARFEAASGFWLNDKNIKIKGVCLHHDAGSLGAAVPLSAWERRFKLLKEVGVNAIRVGHNPASPEFMSLCDKMGFLVMNETFDTWTASKNNGENGYNLYFKDWRERDTRDLALRDRNHPSVIIYSVGNEIRDNLDIPEGFKNIKINKI